MLGECLNADKLDQGSPVLAFAEDHCHLFTSLVPRACGYSEAAQHAAETAHPRFWYTTSIGRGIIFQQSRYWRSTARSFFQLRSNATSATARSPRAFVTAAEFCEAALRRSLNPPSSTQARTFLQYRGRCAHERLLAVPRHTRLAFCRQAVAEISFVDTNTPIARAIAPASIGCVRPRHSDRAPIHCRHQQPASKCQRY